MRFEKEPSRSNTESDAVEIRAPQSPRHRATDPEQPELIASRIFSELSTRS